jgi:hypothetical protein
MARQTEQGGNMSFSEYLVLSACLLLGLHAFANPLVVSGITISNADALALANLPIGGSGITINSGTLTGNVLNGDLQQGTFARGTGPFDYGGIGITRRIGADCHYWRTH